MAAEAVAGDLAPALSSAESKGRAGKVHLARLREVQWAPVKDGTFLYPERRAVCGAQVWGAAGAVAVTCERCRPHKPGTSPAQPEEGGGA